MAQHTSKHGLYLILLILLSTAAFAPSVSHSASQILAGIFNDGSYFFPTDITIYRFLYMNNTIQMQGNSIINATDINATKIYVNGVLIAPDTNESVRVGNLITSNSTQSVAITALQQDNITQASQIAAINVPSTYQAANITSGTFPKGNYIFKDHLAVNNSLFYVNSTSQGVCVNCNTPSEKFEVRNGAIKVGYVTDTFDQLIMIVRNNVLIGTIDNSGSDFRLKAQNNADVFVIDDSNEGLEIRDGGNAYLTKSLIVTNSANATQFFQDGNAVIDSTTDDDTPDSSSEVPDDLELNITTQTKYIQLAENVSIMWGKCTDWCMWKNSTGSLVTETPCGAPICN